MSTARYLNRIFHTPGMLSEQAGLQSSGRSDMSIVNALGKGQPQQEAKWRPAYRGRR
jgi:hypothetical protein